MGLIIVLVVGGVAGWLASMIMKTERQMGLIANVVVGVVGSFLGFCFIGVLGFAAYGLIARTLVAIGGAVLLIAILKALKVLK